MQKGINRAKKLVNSYCNALSYKLIMYLEVYMDQKFKNKFIAYMNEIIQASSEHSKTANHFVKLRDRYLAGKSLTKKMEQNLGWILRDLETGKRFWNR